MDFRFPTTTAFLTVDLRGASRMDEAPLLSSLGMLTGTLLGGGRPALLTSVDRSPPGPLTTTDFPLHHRVSISPIGRRRRGGKRARDNNDDDEDSCCAICLDPLRQKGVAVLPCAHRLHHGCLWGMLPVTVLGASSMCRCPLCRAPFDRHTLGSLGYDVSPKALGRIQRGCRDFRSLLYGDGVMRLPFYDPEHSNPAPEQRARMVRRVLGCQHLGPADGFVYNVCLLALERMFHQKSNFVHSLTVQLNIQPPPVDICDFIQTCIACHVDVLIHTGSVQDGDWFA